MDENTFPDSRVRETIEKSFIPVRIDTGEDQQTPSKYGINAIPTMFVTDETGRVIDQAVGFVPPDSLIQFLNGSLTKG
jgi:thioredoxin-related protein